MAASGKSSEALELAADGKSLEVIVAVLLCCCGVAVVIGTMTWVTIIATPADTSPSFSVMVTDTGGLDPLPLGPVIRPAFDLAIRVDNPMDSRVCRENATVTVSYRGLILGLGRVQDFGVEKGASAEAVAALLRADVVLTDDLRWSMALRAARRRDGGLGGAEDAASEGDHDCQHCARD